MTGTLTATWITTASEASYMDKSLDTDALRVSARDLLTAAKYAERSYRRPYRRFASQLIAAADELDQLRASVTLLANKTEMVGTGETDRKNLATGLIRIEHLAPGTTFIACWLGHDDPDQFVVLNEGVRCIAPGRWYDGVATEIRYASERMDPSTIRDVQPPAVTL